MNKLIKISYIALAIIALLQFSIANASSLSSANGALSLSDIGISNQPIIAGSNITITFQLFNSYSQELTNVNLYLNAPGQIINISPSSTYLIDAIGEGLYGGSNFDHFIYKFHIPSTLKPGTYTIFVNATYQTTQTSAQENIVGSSSMPITFYVYGIPNLSISASAVNLLPNSQMQIPFELNNIGTDTATNISVMLLNNSIFKIIGSDTYALGSLSAGVMQNINFLVQTNSNITNSTYNLNLQVNYTNSIGKKISETIHVPAFAIVNNPNIIATILSSSSQEVFSGSNQTLNINFKNIGLGEAKNISISFLSTNLISLGTPSKFFVSSLAQENSSGSNVSKSIFVQIVNTSAREYTLPVIINYSNINYKVNFKKEYNLSVLLEPEAVFQVQKVNDSAVPGQSYAPVTLQVKNTGNEPAQHIDFTLETIYPLTTINSNQYINELLPNQIQNITFYVSVDSTGNPGNYPITLYEQWNQANMPQNQQFSSLNNYYVIVYTSKSNSESFNFNSKYITYLIAIIIIILAAIGVRFYKKRKHYKHTKK